MPDVLDTSAAGEGTVLDKRESKSITWLHELFHLENMPKKDDKTGKMIDYSPDAKRRSARLTKQNTPYAV